MGLIAGETIAKSSKYKLAQGTIHICYKYIYVLAAEI